MKAAPINTDSFQSSVDLFSEIIKNKIIHNNYYFNFVLVVVVAEILCVISDAVMTHCT